MWPTEIELDMLGPARERWSSIPIDDRVILASAFRDATLNPIWVVDYKLEFHDHRPSGETVLVHHFRIGFASFILIETCRKLFIFDLWLDDGLGLESLAAE